MSGAHTHHRRGYTLIELLISAVVIVSIASLSLRLYTTFDRLRRSADAAMDENRVYSDIDRVFRQQVGSSSKVLTQFQDIESDDSTLILQKPDGEVSLFRGNNAENAVTLTRWTREDGYWICGYMQTFRVPDASFRFSGDHDRTRVLEIESASENRAIARPGTVEITATLRAGGRS